MARNKHPEETIDKILSVAYYLFQTEGYEHTTIQQIVDAVGMSKGAVYHHFKSKEDILDKISIRYYENMAWFSQIKDDSNLNGLEKLRSIMRLQLSDEQKLQLDHITMSLTINPQLLALTMNATMKDAAPFFRTLIEEGIRDGSIQTNHPKELSEVFFLLLNIWIGVYTTEREAFLTKIYFVNEMMTKMGLPILDDALLETAERYFDKIMEARPPRQ